MCSMRRLGRRQPIAAIGSACRLRIGIRNALNACRRHTATSDAYVLAGLAQSEPAPQRMATTRCGLFQMRRVGLVTYTAFHLGGHGLRAPCSLHRTG